MTTTEAARLATHARTTLAAARVEVRKQQEETR